MAAVLEELRKDKLVKCIVSKHDLPSGVAIQIHDYRSTLFRDDDYYAKTKSLYLRRGVAAVYVGNNVAPAYILCGPPKFGYEEDQLTTEPKWSSLKMKKWVFTEKENGEAGHLAFFPIKDAWYAMVGSKNVHIVFSLASLEAARADIASYPGTRTQTAVRIANLLLDSCADIVLHSHGMHDAVYRNQWTLVFEAVFNDHLVHYDKHKIVMFAITCPQVKPVEKQGLTVVPTVALPILKRWGFDTASHVTVLAKNVHQKERVEKDYESKSNSEGAVVYVVYENKSGDEIVGKMYKHKNHIYVLQRMARELLKRKASQAEWKRRFAEVHFDTTSYTDLINDLFMFREWVQQTNNTSEAGWSDKVQHSFMQLWKEFLARDQHHANSNKALMLVGIQGTGKSTLRNALMHTIGSDRVMFVNQDEAGGRKEFMKALTKAAKQKKLVIVDKINHVAKLREEVYRLFNGVAIIEMKYDGSIEELALSRLQKRGKAHLTLQYSENTAGILRSIASAYEPVGAIEAGRHDYLSVNAADTTLRQVNSVVKFLKDKHYISDIAVAPTAAGIRLVTKEYEEAIAQRALSDTKNVRASLVADEVHRAVRHLVPKKSPIKWKWAASDAPEYHITLTYNRNLSKAEHHILISWPTSFKVVVDAFVYNATCAALLVRRADLPLCDNAYPHITIGCADGIAPVNAHKVFTDPDATVVPLNEKLNAVITLM